MLQFLLVKIYHYHYDKIKILCVLHETLSPSVYNIARLIEDFIYCILSTYPPLPFFFLPLFSFPPTPPPLPFPFEKKKGVRGKGDWGKGKG